VCDSLYMTGRGLARESEREREREAERQRNGNMSWHHERRRMKESRVARMMA